MAKQSEFTKADAKQGIKALLEDRGPEKTICPSEVPRKLLDDDWRDEMETVHEAVEELHAEQAIAVLQNGEEVDPTMASGPVRLAIPPEE